MNRTSASAFVGPLLVGVLLVGLSAGCLAQTRATEPKATEEPKAPAEPNVQYTVIDGDTAHVEELSVRGNTRSIVVTPKIGPKVPYEIITSDGSRDLGEGINTSRGAAGKRVWNVLKF